MPARGFKCGDPLQFDPALTPVGKHIDMLKEISNKHDIYKFLDPGPMANLYLPFVESSTPSVELRGVEAEARV